MSARWKRSCVRMTPRRQQAYDLAVQGLSNKEIAERMQVGDKAVKELLLYVFKLKKVRSRAELIVQHYQMQLSELPKGVGV